MNRKSQYVQCTEVTCMLEGGGGGGMEENKSEVMKRMGGTSRMDKRNRKARKEGRKKERGRMQEHTVAVSNTRCVPIRLP